MIEIKCKNGYVLRYAGKIKMGLYGNDTVIAIVAAGSFNTFYNRWDYNSFDVFNREDIESIRGIEDESKT